MGFIYQNTPIYRCENSRGLHWTNRTSCLGRLVPWSRWPIKVSTKCLGTPSHCPQNHHQKTVWQTKILKISNQWWFLRTATKYLQRLHLNLNFHSAKPRCPPHWPLGGDGDNGHCEQVTAPLLRCGPGPPPHLASNRRSPASLLTSHSELTRAAND